MFNPKEFGFILSYRIDCDRVWIWKNEPFILSCNIKTGHCCLSKQPCDILYQGPIKSYCDAIELFEEHKVW